MNELAQETFKAVISGIVTVTLAAIWGNRLSVTWALRQKRKEMALAAADEFFTAYGQFFAIWKLWNFALDEEQG